MIRDRRALSLLEIMVALAVLAIGMTALFGGLSTGKEQYARLDALLTGRLLAQSILEQARYRFGTRDSRFFSLASTPAEVVLAGGRGDWQRPFLALEQVRTPVTAPPGPGNPYFDPAVGPPRPAGLDTSAEKPFWDGFSYEVKVSFDVVVKQGDAPTAIDADGDGRPERDMARMVVQVHFRPPDGSAPERMVCSLSTLLTAPDKMPGVGVYSTF